ncbi:MAG: DUF305 domain-containing protein [Marmoricola sp.]
MRRLLLAGLLAVALTGCGSSAKPASIPQPNAVAVGFCQDMSVHHEQAILMSQYALSKGTPAIRAVAMSILSSQAEEAGAMRGWLRVWGRSPVDPHPMGWMMSMPMPTSTSPDVAAMPGMATPRQMIELYGLSGRGFDVLFLQLMIRHHLAGIDMARYAIAEHASPLVADAARQMIAAQAEDLGTMRALLAADGGHELAPARM